MEDYKKTLNIALFAIVGIMAILGFLTGSKDAGKTDEKASEE